MVKTVQYLFALVLVLACAAPVFAQDDYPKFQLAPGYGNIRFGSPTLTLIGVPPKRHSGFTMDTDFNFNSKFGVDIFTGYYNVVNGITLYTNTFGGTAAIRKSSRVVPFGTAGFGFGSLSSTRSWAYRIGGGFDIPHGDSIAFRFDATKVGFHFDHVWSSGINYSVGVVLNLTQ